MLKPELERSSPNSEIDPNEINREIEYYWHIAKDFLNPNTLETLGLSDEKDKYVAILTFTIRELRMDIYRNSKIMEQAYANPLLRPTIRWIQKELNLSNGTKNFLEKEKDKYFESEYGDPELPLAVELSINNLHAHLTIRPPDNNILNNPLEKRAWVARFKPNLSKFPPTARIPNVVKYE